MIWYVYFFICIKVSNWSRFLLTASVPLRMRTQKCRLRGDPSLLPGRKRRTYRPKVSSPSPAMLTFWYEGQQYTINPVYIPSSLHNCWCEVWGRIKNSWMIMKKHIRTNTGCINYFRYVWFLNALIWNITGIYFKGNNFIDGMNVYS